MVDIKSGDIIFYRPTGIIGWAISKITRSEYSHVALAINSDFILEADRFTKARITPLNYVAEVNNVYRVPELTETQRDRLVDYALSLSDARYDYFQLIGLFLRSVFSIDTTIFNSVNKYICSEVIDLALLAASASRKDDKHIGDITPQELFDKYNLIQVN
jgi:hypothetical protein